MFDRTRQRRARQGRIAALNSLQRHEDWAGSALKRFFEELQSALPDQIDPSIAEADVRRLSNAQLFGIQKAVGNLATAVQFEIPLLELIDARQRAARHDVGPTDTR